MLISKLNYEQRCHILFIFALKNFGNFTLHDVTPFQPFHSISMESYGPRMFTLATGDTTGGFSPHPPGTAANKKNETTGGKQSTMRDATRRKVSEVRELVTAAKKYEDNPPSVPPLKSFRQAYVLQNKTPSEFNNMTNFSLKLRDASFTSRSEPRTFQGSSPRRALSARRQAPKAPRLQGVSDISVRSVTPFHYGKQEHALPEGKIQPMNPSRPHTVLGHSTKKVRSPRKPMKPKRSPSPIGRPGAVSAPPGGKSGATPRSAQESHPQPSVLSPWLQQRLATVGLDGLRNHEEVGHINVMIVTKLTKHPVWCL